MINVLIYRLVIGLYALGIRVASLFKPKAKLFIAGRKGLLDKIRQALSTEQRRRIWVHCASLGEFEQGRPVIEALRAKHPDYAIVLTFFSPSGYEVRKDYDGADYVFYLPVDSPGNSQAFVDIVSPSICLFVKYELWYFYLSALKQNAVETILISARFNKDQGFFKWYGGLQREMLGCFTDIFVQDQASIELLKSININHAIIGGDTRFDRVVKAAAQVAVLPIAEAFCEGHKILIAGSTWTDDEQLLYKALPSLPEGWKLILVPHEVDESHINEIVRSYGNDVVKWSDWNGKSEKRVLLVDKVGFLLQLYRYGTAAWIGGGFGKAGVHNVLEPAVYGMPCFYGPVFHQFTEAVELVELGGAEVINEPEELIKALASFDNTDIYQKKSVAARQYVLGRQGATAKVMERIDHYIL